MATARQIKANRLNAQKCTGPRTPKGRAISSQNALKTGIDAKSEIIRTENRANYDALIATFYTRFRPATPEERRLVDNLIRNEWLSRRYMAAAANVINHNFDKHQDTDLGRVFLECSDQICRAQRRINVAVRDFARALKQLNALRALRVSETPAQLTPNNPLNPKSVSFLISDIRRPDKDRPLENAA
jgi:hypothetical protein